MCDIGSWLVGKSILAELTNQQIIPWAWVLREASYSFRQVNHKVHWNKKYKKVTPFKVKYDFVSKIRISASFTAGYVWREVTLDLDINSIFIFFGSRKWHIYGGIQCFPISTGIAFIVLVKLSHNSAQYPSDGVHHYYC